MSLGAIVLGTLCIQNAGAQSWTAVNNVPNGLSLACNPQLLTDGSVMIQNGLTSDWYKLTPNKSGNYANGTWKKLASTVGQWPNFGGWAPLYEGTEVMPDGRVFAVGGEYNEGQLDWCGNAGYYNPDKDQWTASAIPPAWASANGGMMGDTATATLPNGLVFVSNPFTSDNAAFNFSTNSWIYPYGGPSMLDNDEAGLILLPNKNLYRMDTYFPTTSQAEIFNSSTLTWSFTTPPTYNVVDNPDAEVGPAILQYTGYVIQFGGNGANITYNPVNNTWLPAPSFPSDEFGQIDVADGPAVLLPNGKVMVAGTAGYYAGPSEWFLWDGFALTHIAGPPDSIPTSDGNFTVGGQYNFLMLPSGQVLSVDQTNDVELYNPGGSSSPNWAPAITSVSKTLALGKSYTLTGTQLTGLSTDAGYGDDTQANTNYPIIKLTMQQTGDVVYAKEFLPNTMAICTGKSLETTNFRMPLNGELGFATLQVVTNGIASPGVQVDIVPQNVPKAVGLFAGEGQNGIGNVTSVASLDNVNFSGQSQLIGGSEQVCGVGCTFTGVAVTTNLSAIVYATARVGVTEQIFFYNFHTANWDLAGNQNFPNTATYMTATPPAAATQYLGPGNKVEVVVRGVQPGHISTASFKLSVDVVGVEAN
ncbi:MAG TPA: hypothetical protein VGL56_01510 [Fimbriimonadaceae bacterium]|jgi:hypothetical protein